MSGRLFFAKKTRHLAKTPISFVRTRDSSSQKRTARRCLWSAAAMHSLAKTETYGVELNGIENAYYSVSRYSLA